VVTLCPGLVCGAFLCLDFTPSEKVAIASRIEEAMAGRVGNPQFCKHLQDSEPPQGNSRDLAAAGLQIGYKLKVFVTRQ
jgi:hypothetical protein